MPSMNISLSSVLRIFLLLSLTGLALPALAINCQRAATLVENTLCSSPELRWLDQNLNWMYQTEVVKNPQSIWKQQQDWQKARSSCVSDSCIQRAYLLGLSSLAQVDRNQSMEGNWWNKTAPNGSGGVLTVSRVSRWGYELNATSWAGVNKVSLSGEGRLYYGVGLVDTLKDASGCKLLMIPRPDGTLEVVSNTDFGCKIFLPEGIAVDGVYVRGETDPRPPATLLSLGIFPTEALDQKFRALVGKDYAEYVRTANSYTYSDDLDNQGATVMTLSVKGMANRKAAMIRYTADGKIWALRIEPTSAGKVKIDYVTTEADRSAIPKSLSTWWLNFPDAPEIALSQK